MKLHAVPVSFKDACTFINEKHRHHIAPQRDKFRVAVADTYGNILGVAMVGHPVARHLCDGYTLEVLRLCSTGEKDVCSFLYSRCARIAKEMGYRKIITYILETESGTSLKASGWHLENEKCGGSSWDTPGRPRVRVDYNLFGEIEKYPSGKKLRWEKLLSAE